MHAMWRSQQDFHRGPLWRGMATLGSTALWTSQFTLSTDPAAWVRRPIQTMCTERGQGRPSTPTPLPGQGPSFRHYRDPCWQAMPSKCTDFVLWQKRTSHNEKAWGVWASLVPGLSCGTTRTLPEHLHCTTLDKLLSLRALRAFTHIKGCLHLSCRMLQILCKITKHTGKQSSAKINICQRQFPYLLISTAEYFPSETPMNTQ